MMSLVDHSSIVYPPIHKELYVETTGMWCSSNATAEPLAALLARYGIRSVHTRGPSPPHPVEDWLQLGLPGRFLDILEDELAFRKPFAIQAQAIPAILAGRDVIGIAETGSGKTLAYVLPLMRHILAQPHAVRRPGDGPMALVLVPTRELALQIHRECHRFGAAVRLVSVCVYGGASVSEQISALKRGADIVVATPGRMIEVLCANHGTVTNLRRVSFVVLDEADRMFDMGFEPQVQRIMENIRPDRQCVMFSATFPKRIEGLARKTVRPDVVEIVVGQGRSATALSVDQHVEVFEAGPEAVHRKFRRLLQLLGESSSSSVLIFVSKKSAADSLFADLLKHGYPTLSLHGSMDQGDRDATITDFREGVARVLVATSVAARGLHVDGLDLVINYEAPDHYEDYVHRIGRTGRAGKRGTAYTFLVEKDPLDERIAGDVISAMQQTGQESHATPALVRMRDAFLEREAKSGGGHGRSHSLLGFRGSGFKFDEQEEARHRAKVLHQRLALSGDGASALAAAAAAAAAAATGSSSSDAAAAAAATLVTALSGEDSAAPSSFSSSAALEADRAQHKSHFSAVFDGSNAPKTVDEAIALAQRHAAAAAAGPGARRSGGRKPNVVSARLMVNDYPQPVRWKVLNKVSIAYLQELSGCALTVRGRFVAGRQPTTEDEKLHVLIEGPTQENVDLCRSEIESRIQQCLVRHQAQEEKRALSGTGRYRVV